MNNIFQNLHKNHKNQLQCLQNGFVDENAPKGTKVVDAEGNDIVFKVTDADHDKNVSPMIRKWYFNIKNKIRGSFWLLI